MGGRMKDIWDGGVSNTISSGTVKVFHSPKFSVEHILHTIPGGNGVKRVLRPSKRTVNERKA